MGPAPSEGEGHAPACVLSAVRGLGEKVALCNKPGPGLCASGPHGCGDDVVSAVVPARAGTLVVWWAGGGQGALPPPSQCSFHCLAEGAERETLLLEGLCPDRPRSPLGL